MEPEALRRRVAIAAVVAASVVLASLFVPFLVPFGESPGDPLAVPEYDPASLVVETEDTGGTVDPDVAFGDRGGVVLVDVAHSNDLDRSDIAPLVEGLAATGHTVRFLEIDDNISEELVDAKAFVVVTPGVRFTDQDVAHVKAATDRGMRLLLVGEPDRYTVTSGPLGGGVPVKQSSRFSALASAHGVSFETRYLFNLAQNDGNYKHVSATPPDGSPLDDVEQTSHVTATRVSADGGTPLLVTAEETRLSDGGPSGTHVVAVRAGNTVAVGDRTFLGSDHHTLDDNEAVVEYLVEFLAGGRAPGPAVQDETAVARRVVT